MSKPPKNTQKGKSSTPLAIRSKHGTSDSSTDHISNENPIVSPSQSVERSARSSSSIATRPQGQVPQKSVVQSPSTANNDHGGTIDATVTPQRAKVTTSSKSNGDVSLPPEVSVRGFPDSKSPPVITYAEDKDTNVRSAYQFGSSEPSKDPGKDGSGGGGGQDPNDNRRGSSKRIKETPGENETAYPDHKRRERKAFTKGTVFQMLHVPPTHSERSNLTPFTNLIRSNTYIRRYVVIREDAPDSDDGFLALPIMTYENQGVAKVGVIKRVHVIIFTSTSPPQQTEAEKPQRQEEGMLPNPIRVVPREPGSALDPKARLNFGNPISFDYGVKVKIFGRVHANSMQDFEYQFRHVWRDRQLFVTHHPTTQTSAAPGTPHSPPTASAAPPALTYTPSTQAVAGTSTSPASHIRTDSGVSLSGLTMLQFPGPVDVQVITAAFDSIRNYAEERGIQNIPQLDATRLAHLAANHTVRLQWFDQLKTYVEQTLRNRTQDSQT